MPKIKINKNWLKSFGVCMASSTRKNSPPEFDSNPSRQYDYEAHGNDVVLLSPANTTKFLEGDDSKDFWLSLERIENESTETPPESYFKQVQDLIRSYFEQDYKSASAKYIIKVNSSSLINLAKTASSNEFNDATKMPTAYISSVVVAADGSVEKIKFTGSRSKAARFSHATIDKTISQLSSFNLKGFAIRE